MTTIEDNKLFQDNTTVEAIRHQATHDASKVNAQLILATGQKHKYSVGDTIQPRDHLPRHYDTKPYYRHFNIIKNFLRLSQESAFSQCSTNTYIIKLPPIYQPI